MRLCRLRPGTCSTRTFWTAALFIGEVICPLLVLAISGLLTGLSSALIILGVLTALMTVGTRLRLVSPVE